MRPPSRALGPRADLSNRDWDDVADVDGEAEHPVRHENVLRIVKSEFDVVAVGVRPADRALAYVDCVELEVAGGGVFYDS
jgi:hypothetical protein